MGVSKRSVIKSWLAVLGGVITHFILGSVYTFGNLNPYVTSYIRARSSPPDLRLVETTWILSAGGVCVCLFMLPSGLLVRKLGPKLAAFFGGLLISASVIASYFTIRWTFWALLMTYGVMYGRSIGLLYPIPIACAMQWMPQRKGLVSGLVMAGFGGGTFVYIQIQTLFINPWNLTPDFPRNLTVPIYFSQDVLLDRVPYVFLIMGGSFFVLQIIASPMLGVPGNQSGEDLSLIDRNNEPIQQPHQNEKENQGQADKEREEGTGLNSLKCHHGLTVLEMLKSKFFYLLWFIFLLNGLSPFVAVSMYKVYAQSYIHDDIFLGLIGSFANAFNSAGRIIWGALGDRFSFRCVMITLCMCTAILFLTFLAAPLMAEGQKPMTFIWVCLIYLTYSGNFTLMSTVMSDTFGDTDLVTKIGLIYTTQGAAYALGALLNVTVFPHAGWVGLYSVVSGCALAAGLLAFVHI